MAEIRCYPFFRHLRSEASSHVLQYRRGQVVRSGRGLAFWFRALAASVAEIPVDDREIPFLFHARSADFQDVTTQGVITYRVTDPAALAARIDFSIDLKSGVWLKQPLEQLAEVITQLAQQAALEYVVSRELNVILAEGIDAIRTRITDNLAGEHGIASAGITIGSVRLAAVRPSADLERALQTPTLESLQTAADQATFERRALAVEKERAIAENELQNRIELARREQSLIDQRAENARREAEASAARDRLTAETRSESIRKIEGAKVEAETERVKIYENLDTPVLWSLAARELAGKLQNIEHINITPDLLGPLLTDLMSSARRKLEE